MDVYDNVSRADLDNGLPHIKNSPKQKGSLDLIVSRPAVNERAVLKKAELDTTVGLKGDNWYERGSRRTTNGKGYPDQQLTLMNVRATALIIQDKTQWPLAGDQLYVDFDLSLDSLPPGSHVKIGDTLIEIKELPHTGCKKFAQRFGQDALRFVNSKEGRALNLRGVNAKIIKGGWVKVGDSVERV